MDYLNHLEIKTHHDNVRALRARTTDEGDNSQYYAQFVPFELDPKNAEQNRVAFTVLPPAGRDGMMLSYPFSLQRGLYHVVIEKITDINSSVRPVEITRDHSSKYVYPEPLMAGDRYTITVEIEDAVCYGKNGVRVQMSSTEHNLGPKDIYYQVLVGETTGIKYYVPFNDTDKIDFFVKGITPDLISLHSKNPGFNIHKS